MRILAFLAAGAFLAFAKPCRAQMKIEAPPGWTAQMRGQGATTFAPPDLRAGEKYSTTVYDSVALDGKTLEEYLRAFAGTVGKTPGHLAAPLQIKVTEGRIVSGVGVYNGPQGTQLGAMFLGVSVDGGQNIHMTRTLFSPPDLLSRYQAVNNAILSSVVARARSEAGNNVLRVPQEVLRLMRPGGALVPGIYAGNQYSGEALRYRLRVYLYPNGEYRICDENDKDYYDEFHDVTGVGTISYNRNSGKLNIDYQMDITNGSAYPDDDFCYYGRDAQNKPIIYSEEGALSRRTTLHYVGPPVGRISPGQEKARQAAIEAEKNRYKWVTAPGRGVQMSQIAGVIHHYDVQIYSAGASGMGTNTTDEAYLLLNDGTLHAGMRVPPDQLDVVRSRQNEPSTWGRWRQQNGKYQVSWEGGPYQPLLGTKTIPGAPQTRLQGRYGTGSSSASLAGSSYALWGVTFSRDGRFVKDSRGGAGNSQFMQNGGAPAINSNYDDNGSSSSVTGEDFAAIANRKKNPNGDREGTYSINGYTLTLRYDNGQIERVPFFFRNKEHTSLWFEGSQMSLDDDKK